MAEETGTNETLDSEVNRPDSRSFIARATEHPHATEYLVAGVGIPATTALLACGAEAVGLGPVNPELPMLGGSIAGAWYAFRLARKEDFEDGRLTAHKIASYAIGSVYAGIAAASGMMLFGDAAAFAGWEDTATHAQSTWNQFLAFLGGNGVYAVNYARERLTDSAWCRPGAPRPGTD